MLIRCPHCNSSLDASALEPGQKGLCPRCQSRFRLPCGKVVSYLHHTRDADGDVVFFFKDGEAEPLQSSPIVDVQQLPEKPGFVTGRTLARYLITTSNSAYEVVIPKDTADHLLREITSPGSASSGC